MDSEQLKTFLEVNRTRHFGEAAKHLFLSQSTVSARIQALEQQLGCALFFRTRNDIQLTPAGYRFLRHAESILTAWQRAQQEVTLDEEHAYSLAIGALPSLWDISLQPWIGQLNVKRPDIALLGKVLDKEPLVQGLMEGTLDLAFTFEPPMVERLVVEDIGKTAIVLVSSVANLSIEEAFKSYVAVDWGLAFAVSLARCFPELPPPQIRLPLGRIAQDFIINSGGSAYLAEATVKQELKNGQLFHVKEAPVIERPVYAMYSIESAHREIIEQILQWVKV